MKCSVHKDQTVIMVCQKQQCETCLVCVLCIAGPHNGHKMATIKEVGKVAKERLQGTSTENVKYLEDQKKKIERINSIEQEIGRNQKATQMMMEEQGQLMHETVDKVITHIISQYDVKYERRLKELRGIQHRIRDSIVTIQTSLETDDWLQIIEEEKKSRTSPKEEELPEDTTPGVGAEEINKTLVTGILAALQQCKHPSSSMTDDAHTSDFEGTVYRHKSLQSVASFSLPCEDGIRCVAPCRKDQSYIITYGENSIYLCDKKGVVSKRLAFHSELCGMVITNDNCLLVNFDEEMCVKKMTFDGKQLHTFSTDPLMPNKICVASNGDILVTLVSSIGPVPDSVGVVSRYTPQGKRMVSFERDRFGNTIYPKYIAASRISDLVVVTTLTNEDDDGGLCGHVIVMTWDLQVKFRYLSDGRVIPGDQQYHQDISNKYFIPCIDRHDNIILGDLVSDSIEIIDKYGHRLQSLEQVDGMVSLAISKDDDELWIGKSNGTVEVFMYT